MINKRVVSVRSLFLVIVALCAVAAVPVRAQESSGSILGQILDTSGASIPKAEIKIMNKETGFTRTIVSGADGFYTFPTVPTGTYSVQVTMDGFNPSQVQNVVVNVGASSRVDVKLAVGGVNQTVTVTEAAPTVETTSTSVGQVMLDSDIKNVPLNARDLQGLAIMQPGVTMNESSSATHTLNIAGSRSEQTRYLLEGLDTTFTNQTPPQDPAGIILGVEAIKQFVILTGEPPAQYGGSGGIINRIIKSGTNNFHGSAYEYYRNSVFDARGFFDPQSGAPPFQRNQYGGSIGGPIRKDKTFFFADYEGFRQSLSQSFPATYPDALARTGMLPCSVLSTATYPVCATSTPSTYVNIRTAANNTNDPKNDKYPYVDTIESIFFNGSNPIIPNCTDPVAQEITKTVGGVSVPTGSCAQTVSPAQTFTDDYGIVKFDHAFTSKNNFNVAYNHDYSTATQPGPNPNFADVNILREQFVTGQDTQVITNNLLNTVRFGVNRTFSSIENHLINVTNVDPNFYQDVNPVITSSGAPLGPTITITGLSTIGASPSGRGSSSPKIFGFTMGDIEDDVNYIHGRHALQFGVDFRHFDDNTYSINAPGRGGNISEQSEFLFLTGGPANSFQYLANPGPLCHLGTDPCNAAAGLTQNPNFGRGYRTNYYSLYVDDTVKAKPNLTLTLGIRWEYQPSPSEATGKLTSLYNPTPETSATWKQVGTLYNASRHIFDPRVGFNWDPFKKGMTSIRGGAGMFHTQISANDWNIFGTTWAPYVWNLLPTAIHYPFSFQDLTTYINGNISPATGAPVQEFQGTVTENPSTPTKYGYNLAIQQQLPAHMSLLVGYVGAGGRHIGRPINWEDFYPVVQAPGANTGCGTQTVCGCPPNGPSCLYWPAPTSAPNGLGKGSCPVNPSPVTTPVITATNSSVCPSGTNANTAFNTILGTVYDTNSFYNSLQFTLMRNVASGFNWRINYTHASCVADANSDQPGSQSGGTYTTYTRDSRSGRGRCSFNAEDTVNAVVTYDLPFGRMVGSGFGKSLLSGWTISGITTDSSGYPFDLQDGVNVSRNEPTGGGVDKPNILPGCTPQNAINPHNPVNYVKASCFAPATPGYLGNFGAMRLTGPSFFNTDVSLKKMIAFKREGMSLELRGDMFNMFNRANFSVPVLNGGGGIAFTNSGTSNAPNIQASPLIGQITSTVNPSRQFQVSGRFQF